ncbi:MAG: LytTR family transcriptional regulator [Lachnospiraceae bacterium]|nr:LytTR family transcriptional regulator [Lachnospiraceae bacterium]
MFRTYDAAYSKAASGRSELKIEINVDEKIDDTHIAISCKKLTPEMERLLAMLHILEKQLAVKKGEETCFLDVAEVVYIESVDRKTFMYTKKDVYESEFKLYELEQQLEPCGFFRASKSSLIQLKYIKSLRADINRRIKVTLENGEQLIVSRQYAEELKRKLGLKT